MWQSFIVSLIGLGYTGYLFKNKKFTGGLILGCFSLMIFFNGTVQIPQIFGSIQNSFNFYKRVEDLEKELKNLRLETAEIKQLTVTQKSGIALHVSGKALFDEGLSSSSKNNGPGAMTLFNKDKHVAWKIIAIENNLDFQKLENGKWTTEFSLPQVATTKNEE